MRGSVEHACHGGRARHLPLVLVQLAVSQPVAFAHRRCGGARSTRHAKLQEPSALRRRGRRIDCGPSWRLCRRFSSADGPRQTESWAPFHSPPALAFGCFLRARPDPTRSFDLTSRPTGAKRRATGFSFSSRSIDHSDSMRFDSTRGFFERLDSHHGVAVWQLMAMGACRIHRWIHLFHASSQLCPPRLFFSGVYPGAWNWMRS
jgi:hypothetical protein